MGKRGKYRGETRKTDWFKRWRTGDFRAFLMHLKKHKESSPAHPHCDGLTDLRGANLRMAKLQNARLSRSCLDEAQMFKAYLEGADLSKSELTDVDLCDAILRNSLLVLSRLVNANLRRADLAGADLRGADLTGADLTGANLYRARIDGAVFSLANLCKTKALKMAQGRPKSVENARIDRETFESIRMTPIGRLLDAAGHLIDGQFKYDVAISFAGEDRAVAESIAAALHSLGISVFYDDYERAELWGKNLYDHLSEVYRAKARFCVMLLSKHYAEKQWTNHERQAAQARAFAENREYILPIRLDEAEVTGILGTVGYLRLEKETPLSIARLVKKKLKESMI